MSSQVKKNFEAFTNLKANKKNAVECCGQEFIDGLVKKGIYTKDDEFWRRVNQYLKVPDDAYNTKKAMEKAEQERQIAESKAREIAEKERLFANKKQLYSKDRKGWEIAIFELPETDQYGNKFVAECTKEPELKKITPCSKSTQEAYSYACYLLDCFEKEEEKLTKFFKKYKVLKNLYLMIIYLSGWDEHNPYIGNNKNSKCKENFTGIGFWKGFDFEVLEHLNSEKLLEVSASRKTLTITKQGIKQARDILKTINLEGVDFLLEQRKYHEEYINYQSESDISEEELEEEF
jgi:hypothetical protein